MARTLSLTIRRRMGDIAQQVLPTPTAVLTFRDIDHPFLVGHPGYPSGGSPIKPWRLVQRCAESSEVALRRPAAVDPSNL